MTISTIAKHVSSPESEEMISSFLPAHPEGVLTTLNSSGALQSSVINIFMKDDYQFVFMTLRSTQKFKNLQHNPTISFICYDTFSRAEVAIEGIASLIVDKTQIKETLEVIKKDAKNGSHHTSPYITEDDDYVLFTIHPRKIHMTTYWKRKEKMEAFHESIEFELAMKS